ncbi:CoA transferase [Streptomyces tremellae]|uniref:CaiB/BaiF CoA-transferase family protein n=1 Tax=Streptomyces tremellae TaxID=1124239 RepID=A0ABP7FAR6_9ACTN
MTGFLDAYRGEGPLRGVTVLDFSQMMMGPLATQLLGDLGALVIKVERPGTGEWERGYLPRGTRLDGESPYFLAMNRNKLSVTADLRDPGDTAFLKDLVGRCDAVVENFRPGVMDRLGLGYEDLLAHNPRLVYASGSGYGARGPDVRRPGQDMLVQAASGLAAHSGPADRPPTPVAAPVLDASTAFVLGLSLVSAVLDARENGTPRHVEASLLGTSLLIQCQEALVAMNTDLRWERSATGIAAPWTDSPYGVYATADGHLAVAMTPRTTLAAVFDLPADAVAAGDDEWFARREEIDALIREQLTAAGTADWLARLDEAGIWAAPVRELADVVETPQVAANGYVRTVRTGRDRPVRVVGLPVSMTGVDDIDRLPPPAVGEHNELIRNAVHDRESQQ